MERSMLLVVLDWAHEFAISMGPCLCALVVLTKLRCWCLYDRLEEFLEKC